MKVHIKEDAFADVTNIYIIEEDERGQRFIAQPMKLVFKKFDEYLETQPSIKIGRHFGKVTNFMKNLATALAQAGYEPEVEKELKGELKSTKYHLEDMRKLVFKGTL